MARYSSNNNFKTANNAFNLGGKLVSCKVKKIILDPTTNLAKSYGGHEAVGLIFYNKIRKKAGGFGINPDYKDKEEVAQFDGFAKPLFPFLKYHPLVNEIVTIITLTSKDYLDNRTSVTDYYFPPINLWNHPHHNTLPATQNYQNNNNIIVKSEEYGYSGLQRRTLTGTEGPDIDIPLGKYFKEYLNIKPLLPYEGDYITEGRFGNSIRLGATARGVDKDETTGGEAYEFPTGSISPWSKGGASKNGDPIIIIRNGQPKELDEKGWEHTIEDVNLDPSSIYLTSTQNIENLQVAADMAWYSFGQNVEAKPPPNKAASDFLSNPTEEITAKEQGSAEVVDDKTDSSSTSEETTETTTSTTEGETTGSTETISEEEAGLVDKEDTTEYYQLDDGQTEPEVIERPPLPEGYVLATGENNCQNCVFHKDNQCSKWNAKVRANHENPWVCGAWKEIQPKPGWIKFPNSTRRGRGGKTASIYYDYNPNNYDGVPRTYYHLVASTEEGLGTLDENGHANYSEIKSQVDYISLFPFTYRGSRGWLGINEADGKSPQDFLFEGVNRFNSLIAEQDVIDIFYQYVNWGIAGDDKSTWPYTLLDQQIFDPESNYNRPLYAKSKIKSKDYEEDRAAGRQLLIEKAKPDFLKKLKKIDRELVSDFEITLDNGYFHDYVTEGRNTTLICSFKIIDLKD